MGLEGEGSKGCLYIMRRKLSDPRDKATAQWGAEVSLKV